MGKNNLIIRRKADGTILGTNMAEVKRRIKSTDKSFKDYKEGIYELVNWKGDVVQTIKFEIVQTGTLRGSGTKKGKSSASSSKGVKLRVKNVA